MKTRVEIERELEANIPRDVVSSRSGGGSKKLSYLESWYVIDRLNKVFGNLGWDSETTEMVEVGLSSGSQLPAYRAKVRITVSAPVYDANGGLEGFRNVVKEGTGWGSDKSAQNAHEMACKEAESDALKRAAMKLGISMGLGLYEKTGEFVEDEAPKAVAQGARPNPVGAVMQTETGPRVVKETPDRETLNKKITAVSRVVIAKKLKTIDELKAEMKTKYGADATAALSDQHAKTLLTELETLANG